MSRKIFPFNQREEKHAKFIEGRDVRDKLEGDIRIGESGIRNFFVTTSVDGSTTNDNFRYRFGKKSESMNGQHVLLEIDDNFTGIQEAIIPHELGRVPEGALILEQYEQFPVSKTIRTTAGTVGLMKFNDRWNQSEFTIQYENPRATAGGDKFRVMFLLY